MPLCGNVWIFLSLRFNVKSILENVQVLKLPFQPLRNTKIDKIPNLEPLNKNKMAMFETLDSTILISRKI